MILIDFEKKKHLFLIILTLYKKMIYSKRCFKKKLPFYFIYSLFQTLRC